MTLSSFTSTTSPSSLKGKTLFITGASRGIGLAIALRAARDGANIVIAAKTAEPDPRLPGTIHTAAAEVVAAGGQALALQVDIRDEDAVQAAVARAAEHFGGIDILVNNASAISITRTTDTRTIYELSSDDAIAAAVTTARAIHATEEKLVLPFTDTIEISREHLDQTPKIPREH